MPPGRRGGEPVQRTHPGTAEPEIEFDQPERSEEEREYLDAQADTEAEMAAAVRQIREDKARNLKAMADHASSRRGGLPPIIALPTFQHVDETVCLDSDGRPAGDKHKRQKWVPVDVKDGVTNRSKVQRHQSQGFSIVKDRGDGSEKHSNFGVLMEITATNAAVRQEVLAPAGAVDPAEYFAAIYEQDIQRYNDRVGVEAGRSHRVGERNWMRRDTTPPAPVSAGEL